MSAANRAGFDALSAAKAIAFGVPAALLAGAYAGLESVDRRTVDAARAMGMREGQIVGKVELPLGMPIVVGGTGLYLRAALAELRLPPAPRPGARERWGRLYDEAGAEAAYGALAERDPAAAAVVHPNDRRRVVRALELTDAGESLATETSRLWTDDTRHPTLVVGLEVPARTLAERIDARTRAMVERGVEKEVVDGLGWIKGEVVEITPDDPQLKIPHMGWNSLEVVREHPLLAGIPTGDEGLDAYFVHSFHMRTANPGDLVARADYGGPVTAIGGRDNLAGTQFPPEKSQKLGLALIANFLQWRP